MSVIDLRGILIVLTIRYEYIISFCRNFIYAISLYVHYTILVENYNSFDK